LKGRGRRIESPFHLPDRSLCPSNANKTAEHTPPRTPLLWVVALVRSLHPPFAMEDPNKAALDRLRQAIPRFRPTAVGSTSSSTSAPVGRTVGASTADAAASTDAVDDSDGERMQMRAESREMVKHGVGKPPAERGMDANRGRCYTAWIPYTPTPRRFALAPVDPDYSY
jgi:hypothetical protein